MRRRALGMVLFLCLWAGNVVAGTGTAHDVILDAMGKSAVELFNELGAPYVKYDFSPCLLFEYTNITIGDRNYGLSFIIMGHKVVGGGYMESIPRPSLQTGPDFGQNWLGDFIGMNIEDVTALMGQPHSYMFAPLFLPETLGYAHGETAGDQRVDYFSFELEENKVIMAHYSRMGPLNAAGAKALVLELDARLMLGLTDPVWLYYNSDNDDALNKDTEFWRFSRFVADTPHDIMLFGRVSQKIGTIFLSMSVADHRQQGSQSRYIYELMLQAAENDLRVYKVHGDLNRLRNLLD